MKKNLFEVPEIEEVSSLLKQSTIVQTSSIADVLPYIDKETWFLIDLDNTLFEAEQAFGHVNWFYDEVKQKLQRGMTQEEAVKDTYPDWIKAQAMCSVKACEKSCVSLLLSMQNRGIVIMGLTHRQPSMSDVTVNQVASLGFDFSKTACFKHTFVMPANPSILYSQGILFVGDFNKKGEVLVSFFDVANQMPKRIVFIDDKKENVEEVQYTLSSHQIEYVGVHYTAVENSTPIYSREIARFQQQLLKKMISNESAKLLMEKEQFGIL